MQNFKALNNVITALKTNKIDAFIDENIENVDSAKYVPVDLNDGLDNEHRKIYQNSCFLFRNGDKFKTNWDLLIMLLSIWNCFVLPFQVAFEPKFEDNLFFEISNYIIDFAFFCDIVINFRTSFINSRTGEEVFEPRKIAKNYIYSLRFWSDLIATIPFDTFASLILGQSDTEILQLFSLLKLARVLRLSRIIAYLNVRNEVKMSLKLFKLIFYLTLYLHCLGCAWFEMAKRRDKKWIPPLDYVFVTTTYFEENTNYKYWIALYHSVLMLTGNDIGPRGWEQVAFTTFFVMVGALINANLFGELSVIVSTMNRKASQFHDKLDICNTAMKNLRLPENMQKKVISFVTYTQGLYESQDELKTFLSLISPSLREDVLRCIFAETLNGNPIFKGNDDLIQYITTRLITSNHLPEDTIIRQGEEGDALYFIAKGECKVYVRNHKGENDPTGIIHPGELFGEVALICNCRRTATVLTRNYSTLGFIKKSVFHDLSKQYTEVYTLLRK